MYVRTKRRAYITYHNQHLWVKIKISINKLMKFVTQASIMVCQSSQQ